MGAVMFFIMFLALIPVGAFLVRVLDAFGLLGDLSDPVEWEVAEDE